MTGLTYRQARLVVLGFGTALVAAVAASAWFRGADPVEVGAILLLLPVLVGLTLGDATGGAIAGALASVVYVVVRFMTLPDELPRADFVASVIVRVLLFGAVGVLGGFANAMLRRSLIKLELYDEVDDATGVGNARALLHIVDREVARARRYDSAFTLAVLHIDRQSSVGVKHGVADRALRVLCQALDHAARTTDLVTHVPLAEGDDVVIVLTETGRSGAEVFADRLVERARSLLGDEGLAVTNGALSADVLSFPADEAGMTAYRDRVAAVVEASSLTFAEGDS